MIIKEVSKYWKEGLKFAEEHNLTPYVAEYDKDYEGLMNVKDIPYLYELLYEDFIKKYSYKFDLIKGK